MMIFVSAVSGALDVDNVDYVLRDARACHMPYGEINIASLMRSLRIHPLATGEPRIVLAQEGIGTLSSFLHARQDMYLTIMPLRFQTKICRL